MCVFLLPNDFDTCDALYFPDYSNYNANVVGLVVDAGAIGLSDTDHLLSYGVVVCSGTTNPDAPSRVCDAVDDIDLATGTYEPTMDVTAPALTFSKLVVHGFWKGGKGPVSVDVGSAGQGEDPGILVVFPNNTPENQWAVVGTAT